MNHPPAWYSKCSQEWRFNVATSIQAWMTAWSSTLANVSLTLATWLKGDPSILVPTWGKELGTLRRSPLETSSVLFTLNCLVLLYVSLIVGSLWCNYLALLLFGFPSCVFLWRQFCGCVLWDFSFVENPIFRVAFLSDFLDIRKAPCFSWLSRVYSLFVVF